MRFTLTVVFCLLAGQSAFSGNRPHAHQTDRSLDLFDLKVQVPEGWKLHQDAEVGNRLLMGFEKDQEYVTLYGVKSEKVDAKALFINGSQVIDDIKTVAQGPFKWEVVTTSKKSDLAGAPTYFVKGFATEHNGVSYFGYSRALTKTAAEANADVFLKGICAYVDGRSLTPKGYTGKKYYLGFGDLLSGGMGNEVKYDIKHTHDIFTGEVGGAYIGEKIVGGGGSSLKAKWQEIGSKITANDMYVQYSSGHGSTSGLEYGVSYKAIRDNALSYPAKEVIIFTMACHSGGLVDSFNAEKAKWENWQKEGRTLFVMASSTVQQLSQTGPGTDSDEPNGPYGSAGSAFGHALWKALIGYVDGFVDGVKDGFLSLGEIRDFAAWKTKKLKGHTPVSTGSYNPGPIMNRVPPKTWVDRMEGATEGLTDEEVMERIQDLDSAQRVR